jgi:hypothetical protein
VAPGEAEPRPQARVSDSHGLLEAAFLDGATRLVAQNDSGAEIRRIFLLLFEVLDDADRFPRRWKHSFHWSDPDVPRSVRHLAARMLGRN